MPITCTYYLTTPSFIQPCKIFVCCYSTLCTLPVSSNLIIDGSEIWLRYSSRSVTWVAFLCVCHWNGCFHKSAYTPVALQWVTVLAVHSCIFPCCHANGLAVLIQSHMGCLWTDWISRCSVLLRDGTVSCSVSEQFGYMLYMREGGLMAGG